TMRGFDLEGEASDGLTYDQLTVDALAGDDQLYAGLIPNSTVLTGNDVLGAITVSNLVLAGGAGNDRLVGTRFADVLISGEGSDTVTGNAGEDTFIEIDIDGIADTDTLIEQRDLNFSLSDNSLVISGSEPAPTNENPNAVISVNENESAVGIFELFELFGGAHANRFTINDFTKSARFDGTEGGDTYELTLSGPIMNMSETFVVDSGTSGTDTVKIWGSTIADTLHLDADTSMQQVDFTSTTASDTFKLEYHGQKTVNLTKSSTEAQVKAALENLSTIAAGSIQVTRDTDAKINPVTTNTSWHIKFLPGYGTDVNPEGAFFHITSSDDLVAFAHPERAMVTRIDPDAVSGLGGSGLDLDAMFEQPANQTQMFSMQDGATGTFKLSYNGSAFTAANLSKTGDTNTAIAADRLAIKTALESTVSGLKVDVNGSGTKRDPWRVKILDGAKDANGNYFAFEVNNDNATKPLDQADAAATVKPSASLAQLADYQRVYYDFSAENVEIHGGRGDDVFIADDSMAAMFVYGDQGADTFMIGRVLETKAVRLDTNENGVIDINDELIDVVDGLDGITAGVSFNAYFYGGAGDDYFEVNHNVGELSLFGESGDDTFFLKALLQETTNNKAEEIDGGEITAGAGDENNFVSENDSDTLINYVENNRVEIFGGSGFDTVVVAGTQIGDEFYIFTDNDNQQYLFGAGLKLENINGIERLALLTGAGDDTVYLYGLVDELSLLLNMGSGDDRLIVGGPEETFNVVYPAASAVYTVEHALLVDQFKTSELIYNDVVFSRRDTGPTITQTNVNAFEEFYKKWISADVDPAQIKINDKHWE
ncbi:MAG TPA: hypothetical protein VLA24_09525, partial [Pseudomonadales bacterium]|nr:hypothetical protein [Pseudomonadales bacterium]